MFGAQGAYEQVSGGGIPHHDMTHELLAGAAGFEAVRMYEHHREQARRQAREQAHYRWEQQHGQY